MSGTLDLTNQYGETSINTVVGGDSFPTSPIATHTILSNLTSGTANPAANTYAAVSAVLLPTQLLTGYTSGAGAVAGTDTVIQAIQKLNGNHAALQAAGLVPATEAITTAGALSTTVMESTVSNVTAGTYAATLAAPSSQDGQMKIIKAVATMTHTVTLALTNVLFSGAYTASGSTTMTFTNAGDCAVFMAVGAKWVYLGGSAVVS